VNVGVSYLWSCCVVVVSGRHWRPARRSPLSFPHRRIPLCWPRLGSSQVATLYIHQLSLNLWTAGHHWNKKKTKHRHIWQIVLWDKLRLPEQEPLTVEMTWCSDITRHNDVTVNSSFLCSTSRQWKHRRRPQRRCIYRATHHVMPWLEIGMAWWTVNYFHKRTQMWKWCSGITRHNDVTVNYFHKRTQMWKWCIKD